MDCILKDDAKDREYFTVIPNYILNHSSAVDQALYLQMKRCAGENGRCYAGSRYLCGQLGVGWSRLKRSLQYLIDNRWVTFEGTQKIGTPGGDQSVNVYKVNDIWKMNIEYFRRKRKKSGGK